MKRIFQLKLHWQILIAMILGTLIGIILKSIYPDKPEGIFYQVLISFGTIFIRLLRMVIVPLVFTSIVSGVAGVGSGKGLGRLGIKAMAYFLTTSLIAIIIGLTLTNILQPGVGSAIPVSSDFDPSSINSSASPADILIRMIPLNPFEAMVTGDMMGIIFFSIFLGFGITALNPKGQNLLRNIFESAFEAMMKITNIIIKLAPLGVLGLITKAVAETGLDMFSSLFLYVLTIALSLTIHLWVVLPTIFFTFTRINPLLFLKAMASAMITAFSTSSSNATLPVTISCIEENVGVSNRISSFVLPLGATVNMDGTALYECAGVIFISQVLGIHLTIAQQLVVVLTALLASIGCAGIPSAGLVIIFIVTQAVGFKDAQVAMIIGTMLAVDRPLDMYRTMVNITSDSVCTVIVAKSEGETGLCDKMR